MKAKPRVIAAALAGALSITSAYAQNTTPDKVKTRIGTSPSLCLSQLLTIPPKSKELGRVPTRTLEPQHDRLT
jgi:hypothetical protein